jgi:polysaccharide export outer membrane protein
MMNLSTWILMAAGLILAGGQVQEAEKPADPSFSSQKDASKGKNASASQTAENEAEYKIGPQDVLRIDVWKEPEISRTVPVRPDGKISLPLLNDVQATGLTAMQLAGAIADGLKKFITNPQVTVSIAEINSRRVYVTGEVTKPGSLPLLPNMTVLQALSSSGGFTQFAKIKSIYVLRTTDGKQERLPFNYKEVINGQKPDQNIQLQPGDVVVVP